MVIETRIIREKLFLTQVEFAEKLGLSVSSIRKWEQGKCKPSLRHLKLILDFAKENGVAV